MKRTIPLNTQVRIGVTREPLKVVGMKKFKAIIVRTFNALVPCNATSVINDNMMLSGMRWSWCGELVGIIFLATNLTTRYAKAALHSVLRLLRKERY